MISVDRSAVHGKPDKQGLLALFVVVLMLLVTACERPTEVQRFGGATMGTQWSVQVGELPVGVSVERLQSDVENLLQMINDQMSNYQEDSLVSRFNALPAGEELIVPPDFAQVLATALDLAEQTSGAYDPTAGALVNAWGFGPEGRRETPPGEDEIAAALAKTGWQELPFDRQSRVLTQPGGFQLEFGSIAKGYAVDRIATHLDQLGIDSYLVAIAGDMRLSGNKPDGEPWRIAVERPVAGQRAVHTVIAPGDGAISTSGDYRNFFRDQGREYAHIVDARDGQPLTHELASVTVLHERAGMADPLATAIFVLGPEEGLAFAERNDLAVFLIIRGAEGFRERMTPAFARHLEPEIE